ncbi:MULTISPECIES: LPS translocon maturation chaperone LptM [Nitrincola]|uniref:Lipopeptide n=1 Tax=Nitrincola tibetensis TaxID=2219697 RepID=A0A364NPH4_9GAMM|nr:MULTISPECIES: lipoprotein [Nitrincola]RAU18785.1 hypothetical protein DN062_04690 [Nitrincola tibetensis]
MKRLWPVLFTGFLLLSACGQKGPLYMPESTPETQQPQ